MQEQELKIRQLRLLKTLEYKSEWGEDQSEIRQELADLYRWGRPTKATVDLPFFVKG